MSRQKLDFFNKATQKPADVSPEERKEEELRVLARNLRQENNTLVGKKWELEREIANGASTANKSELREELKKINGQIQVGNYQERINKLLTQIHDMEVERTGHSDVGSSSPYEL